jgi:hypothetical protein
MRRSITGQISRQAHFFNNQNDRLIRSEQFRKGLVGIPPGLYYGRTPSVVFHKSVRVRAHYLIYYDFNFHACLGQTICPSQEGIVSSFNITQSYKSNSARIPKLEVFSSVLRVSASCRTKSGCQLHHILLKSIQQNDSLFVAVLFTRSRQ